jgi:hypothetical protein
MPTLSLETWRRLIISEIQNQTLNLAVTNEEIIEKSIFLCWIINLGV